MQPTNVPTTGFAALLPSFLPANGVSHFPIYINTNSFVNSTFFFTSSQQRFPHPHSWQKFQPTIQPSHCPSKKPSLVQHQIQVFNHLLHFFAISSTLYHTFRLSQPSFCSSPQSGVFKVSIVYIYWFIRSWYQSMFSTNTVSIFLVLFPQHYFAVARQFRDIIYIYRNK